MASTNDATQKELVLNELRAGNYLTGYRALMDLGVMRLASRINDLKNDGHVIETKRVEVTARNGRIAHVAAYRLARA